jgi:hypothetical protein
MIMGVDQARKDEKALKADRFARMNSAFHAEADYSAITDVNIQSARFPAV